MNHKYFPIALLLSLPYLAFAESPTPANTPATATIPAVTQPSPTPEAMNCNYHFAKELKTIDPTLIESWSQKAVIQAFTMDSNQLNTQLDALKSCFTDQGWQGFSSAFEKSGNSKAIKSKQLTVNAQLNGNTTLHAIKENQWKITLPIQVTYQNKEQKLNQALTVSLLITRKPSGDLGIMQIIAIPVKAAPTTPN